MNSRTPYFIRQIIMTALATLAKKTITKANKIAIFGHENVDGDCV